MALPPGNAWMSEAEYLAFERASEIKHEYIEGEIYAMAGASREHNLICTSVSFILYGQLRGKKCEIYPSDMRVKIQAAGRYTYPDISIVCGEPEFADGKFDTLLNPVVLIEVLSDSTEAYDRGDKFQHYRQIASLQHYLLISQNQARIESYTRKTDGTWIFMDTVGLQASLKLDSIQCTIPLAGIYETVTFGDQSSETTTTSTE